VHRRKLGVVVVAPAGRAESVQVLVQRGLVAELLAVDPAVDQRTRRAQGDLRVMTEKHLTPDPLGT